MAHANACSVPECEKPAQKVGLCHAHYRRQRLGQPLDTPVRSWGLKESCSIEGCDKAAKGRGMCPAHYRRWRLGEPLDTPLRRRGGADATCEVDGCARPHLAGGLCAMHHQRLRRAGELGPAGALQAPAGSGYVNPDGYKVFVIKGLSILEHRRVMEAILGRPLEPFENVHHKNGLRADNRPANLELWCKPQPCGQRPEDLVAWVVEHYRDLVRAELEKPCP